MPITIFSKNSKGAGAPIYGSSCYPPCAEEQTEAQSQEVTCGGSPGGSGRTRWGWESAGPQALNATRQPWAGAVPSSCKHLLSDYCVPDTVLGTTGNKRTKSLASLPNVLDTDTEEEAHFVNIFQPVGLGYVLNKA